MASEQLPLSESWAPPKLNKYQVSVEGRKHIDVYDVLDLYQVKSHAVGHAVKKLLMAGRRGHKDMSTDYREAIASINRAIEMEEGDLL